jgi:hypothetical protein
MRIPLAILTALVLALTAAAGAQASLARFLGAATSQLSLKNGDGTVVIIARGSVIGSVARGRITITDRPSGAVTDIVVTGNNSIVERSDLTTVYRGTEMRFRVFAGTWRVGIAGEGIDLSAVADGTVTLKGEDGTYAIDGSSYRRWPTEFKSFQLGD